MKRLFRNIIFIVLLGFLFLPLLQSNFHVFKIVRLAGAYTPVADTSFSAQGWFSGKFQTHKEKYLSDTFGLRNLFIRSRNQVDFDLFKKINSTDFALGNNDDLFPTWYFDSYAGWNFIGTVKLKARLDKLKFLQDAMAKMNKTLLFVLAPSKTLFNPEDVPAKYNGADSINYTVCAELLKTEGLNYIDFNSYFIDNKFKSKYPLFYKNGSHWTAYGACIAGDSIMTILEKLTHTKLPHTQWKDNITFDDANADELELEDDLNLLFRQKQDKLGHPHISNPIDTTTKKLGALLIGDSYILILEKRYNFWSNFSGGNLCYYYTQVFPTDDKSFVWINMFNLKEAIQKNDVFIVECTESKLNDLGWGFPDSTLKVLNLQMPATVTTKKQ